MQFYYEIIIAILLWDYNELLDTYQNNHFIMDFNVFPDNNQNNAILIGDYN